MKFIIENIESSHISSKYFDDFIHSKQVDKILNGFLLVGHWANTYPLNYIYTRILDILFLFQKNVDLKMVLTNESNVDKFLKGIYLLFKAFPGMSGEFMNFACFIKENLKVYITDTSLYNYAIKSIDKLLYFSEKVLVKSQYYNKNSLFLKYNTEKQ
jgi:hypothetical protein